MEASEFEIDENRINKLRSAIAEVKRQTLEVIALHDQIEYGENPRLERLYRARRDEAKVQAMVSSFEGHKAQRKLELTRQVVSENLGVSEKDIEDKVEEELNGRAQFVAINLKAQEQSQAAIAQMRKPLTAEEASILREVYVRVAALAHPEIASRTEKYGQFLEAARLCLESGLEGKLREIAVECEFIAENNEVKESCDISTLEMQLSLAQASLEMQREKLKIVKTRYPYTLRELMDDEEWMAARLSPQNYLVEKWEKIRKDSYDELERFISDNPL